MISLAQMVVVGRVSLTNKFAAVSRNKKLPEWAWSRGHKGCTVVMGLRILTQYSVLSCYPPLYNRLEQKTRVNKSIRTIGKKLERLLTRTELKLRVLELRRTPPGRIRKVNGDRVASQLGAARRSQPAQKAQTESVARRENLETQSEEATSISVLKKHRGSGTRYGRRVA